jgi:hypothetical protein
MAVGRRVAVVASIAAAIAAAPAAKAATRPPPASIVHSFSGSCEISGPISPNPGITVVPRPGSRFSFHGSGSCVGLLDKRTRERTLSARIDFVDVTTLFDTCELGPDFDLHGVLTIAPPHGRPARIRITLNLARLAVVGPFQIRGAGGGVARGIAQFSPDDAQAAITQCAGADGGITMAKLSASLPSSRLPKRRCRVRTRTRRVSSSGP